MSKFRIAAMAATLLIAVPVFAQEAQIDQERANQRAADILNNPNVHWTIKEQTALLVDAPYVRPNDMWELTHMFREMTGDDERVIFTACANAIKDNAGDYYSKEAAAEAYWNNLFNNPATVTTTVTTTPSGSTAVTTTTTPVTTPPTVVVTTPPPAITTPPTAYTPTPTPTTPPYGDTSATRGQAMVGAGMAIGTGMSDYAAYELLQRDLNAQDRTTFRMLWDGMTSGQQQALIDVARNSAYYYTARSNGIYYYYYPYLALAM